MNQQNCKFFSKQKLVDITPTHKTDDDSMGKTNHRLNNLLLTILVVW